MMRSQFGSAFAGGFTHPPAALFAECNPPAEIAVCVKADRVAAMGTWGEEPGPYTAHCMEPGSRHGEKSQAHTLRIAWNRGADMGRRARPIHCALHGTGEQTWGEEPGPYTALHGTGEQTWGEEPGPYTVHCMEPGSRHGEKSQAHLLRTAWNRGADMGRRARPIHCALHGTGEQTWGEEPGPFTAHCMCTSKLYRVSP